MIKCHAYKQLAGHPLCELYYQKKNSWHVIKPSANWSYPSESSTSQEREKKKSGILSDSQATTILDQREARREATDWQDNWY